MKYFSIQEKCAENIGKKRDEICVSRVKLCYNRVECCF